jgi:prephenate dehydrogenase
VGAQPPLRALFFIVSAALQEPVIAIIGPGLLGGSVALAIKEKSPQSTVRVWARRQAAADQVRAAGAATFASTDLAAVVRGATLVVLASPVEHMTALAAEMAPWLAATTLVTDVGSVKGRIVQDVAQALRVGASRFIGSHPMAGSEKTGFEHARSDLFEGATCIVTPAPEAAPQDVERIQRFWTALGCRLLMMSAAEHDHKVARISHLPHAVAAAVVRAAMGQDPSTAECTGNGFRDATRIASGDPALWTGILFDNREPVLSALRDAQREMAVLVEILERMDEGALTRYLSEARELREQVPPASPHPYGSTQSS